MTIAHLKGELHRVSVYCCMEEYSNFTQQYGKISIGISSLLYGIWCLPTSQASSEGDGATASKLLQELQEVREEAVATKENLNSFRECSDKLQNELQVRDLSIAQLQEELQQLRVALAKTAESPSPQSPLSPSQSPSPQQQQPAPASNPKKKVVKDHRHGAKGKMAAAAKDKPSLSRKISAAENQTSDKSTGLNGSQRLPRTDAGTQTSDQPRSVSEEEVEEMIGEYQEKIIQMQELHAAEILDMEARHIAESEALKRDAQMLEEECKVLKTVIEKLQCSHEVSSLGDISADLSCVH